MKDTIVIKRDIKMLVTSIISVDYSVLNLSDICYCDFWKGVPLDIPDRAKHSPSVSTFLQSLYGTQISLFIRKNTI